MKAPDCVVATEDTFSRFEEIIGPLGSGAIGVAGPRGVGKSTLLEAYRDGRFIGAGREHLTLFESVPVRYDPRDFALHLYASFCQKTIEFSEQHAGRQPGIWWQRFLGLSRLVPSLPTLLTWLAAGSLVTALLYEKSPGNRIPLVALAWLLGIALAAGVIMSILTGKNYPTQNWTPSLTVADLSAPVQLRPGKAGYNSFPTAAHYRLVWEPNTFIRFQRWTQWHTGEDTPSYELSGVGGRLP